MRKREAGFTMIELLLAMALFSFMLVIVTVAFMTLTRYYEAGIASRVVQQNVRTVINQIDQNVRMAGRAWTPVSQTTDRLCLSAGASTTEYAISSLSGPRNLYVKTVPDVYPNCPDPTDLTGWTQLNDNSVEASFLQSDITTQLRGTLGTVTVAVGFAARSLVYNTTTTVNVSNINLSTVKCNPGVNIQFCATATLLITGTLRGVMP